MMGNYSYEFTFDLLFPLPGSTANKALTNNSVPVYVGSLGFIAERAKTENILAFTQKMSDVRVLK